MENLEVQRSVLSLGELFVNKLGLEPGVDTFARWMAHYIAQQMNKAENSQGTEKESAEKACFDTILKVWEHRWKLPSGKRPFEDFEPILMLIEKLNPERESAFYYHQLPENGRRDLQINENMSEWIKTAEEMDQAARICITYALDQSVLQIKTDETEQWLENASKLTSDDDTKIIRGLINKNLPLPSEYGDDDIISNYTSETLKNYSLEKVKSRIKHLQAFSKVSKKMLSALKIELKDLRKNKKKS